MRKGLQADFPHPDFLPGICRTQCPAPCAAISLAFCMALSIVAMSYLQLKAPETLVGKVMALTVMLANFVAPAGQVVYGLAFDRVPAWSVALVATVATAAVAAWLSRSIRER